MLVRKRRRCNQLVPLALNFDFRSAVEWLGGSREVDPEIAAKRERKRQPQESKRQAEANEFRQRDRKRLYKIWKGQSPPPAALSKVI